MSSLGALVGIYLAIAAAAALASYAIHGVVKKYNRDAENYNATKPENAAPHKLRSKFMAVIPWLLGIIPGLLVGLLLHQPFDRRNTLVKLITDNKDHFFARAKDTVADINVPESVAKTAVDKIERGKLSDTIDQVEKDQTDKDEYVKLFNELQAAYGAAGTVFRKGDSTIGGLGYY